MSKVSSTKRVVSVLLGLLLIFISCFSLLPISVIAATGVTYYCDAVNGDDTTHDGLSTSSAFKTIQRAADLTNPGDTVLIMNGTYTDTSSEGVVKISRSGSADAYITYKPYSDHTPIIHSTKWNNVLVRGAAYIIIDGLTIVGNNDNITYAQGMEVYNYYQTAKKTGTVDWAYVSTTNTNGISIDQDKTTLVNSHHVIVRNCDVTKCAGGGISAISADYITFENNKVYNNCNYNIWANSGISILTPTNFDTNTTTYRNIIRNNISYGNENLVPWENTSAISDGNGIIMDSFIENSYTGKTLVSNNICYENGGTGIHAYNSSYIDIINNTIYNNSRSPALAWPQIGLNACSYSNMLNNIVYSRTGESCMSWNVGTTSTSDYNLFYNGSVISLGANDLIQDPQFVNLANKDFHLQQGSLGMDTGTSTLAPTTDISGNVRPAGYGFDRGAFEAAGNNPPAYPPAAFSLLTPKNGYRGIARTGTVFDWQDATNATSYTLIVDNNSDFSSPEINVSNIPTSTYTSTITLEVRTYYYYKVLAVNANGSTPCNTVFKFKTGN